MKPLLPLVPLLITAGLAASESTTSFIPESLHSTDPAAPETQTHGAHMNTSLLEVAQAQSDLVDEAILHRANSRGLLGQGATDLGGVFHLASDDLIEDGLFSACFGIRGDGGKGQAGAPELSDAEELAVELRADLSKIVEGQGDLFNEPWLKYAKMNFGRAEQAVKTLIVDGSPNAISIDDFNYGLSTFVRALDELPSWTPGNSGWGDIKDSKKPSSKRLKVMLKAIREVQEKAKRMPEFQPVEDLKFDKSTTPEDASEYGIRMVAIVERMLYEGTLEQVTGEGKEKTKLVMNAPFADLRSALTALDGVAATGKDYKEKSTALKQAVHEVRSKVAEFNKALEELTRVHPWARQRTDLVEPLMDLFDKNFKGLTLPKNK